MSSQLLTKGHVDYPPVMWGGGGLVASVGGIPTQNSEFTPT